MGLINYDDARRLVRRMLGVYSTLAGVSIPGTAASNTNILRVPLSEAITVSGSARLHLVTGGTAAGPQILFCKSLAGTATAGTANAFGTYTFGTAANDATAWVALNSTDFAAGDELIIVNVAGTVASTPAINFTLGYQDTLS